MSTEARQRSKWEDPEDEKPSKENTAPAADLSAPAPNAVPTMNLKKWAEGKTGGAYIPPFRLRQLQQQAEDKKSIEYQRLTWEALKKSINGLLNKVNGTNIKNIIPEIFGENLVRGRGLFARSCMKAQMASRSFTDVYAALIAVVNTKLPENGELILKRIVIQFRRSIKRNDKPVCLAMTSFIAHLINQQVCHELLGLQLLTVLLEKPTDDSVELAVNFVTEAGAALQELSPQGLNAIFESFRSILHESDIDKRVQYMIEGLFAVRKSKFADHPAIKPELDLVDSSDQITHEVSLDDELNAEQNLDVFKFDDEFLANEEAYELIKKEILGEDEDEEDGDGDDEADDGDEGDADAGQGGMEIQDETGTDTVNLRRTIYLTLMSSLDMEECAHKLLKLKVSDSQMKEIPTMLIECCNQEKSYMKFYGMLGERFCRLNPINQQIFDELFGQYYATIHRLETNKLRNCAKFFAHLLHSDAMPWNALEYIHLNEEETTSSSRIFIKILFQELSEYLGLHKLRDRLQDEFMAAYFQGLFPRHNPKDTRFSINFFTSIGLGGLTEQLREHLKTMPKPVPQRPVLSSSSSSSSSDSSDSSDSDSSSSSSDSSVDRRKKKQPKKDQRIPPPPPQRIPPPPPGPPPPSARNDSRRGDDDDRRGDRRDGDRRREDNDDRKPRGSRDEFGRDKRDDRRRDRSASPKRRTGRSRSPSASPKRRGGRSPSPKSRRDRSESPKRRGGRSPSPKSKRDRSPSPKSRRDRSASPRGRRDRSVSPRARRDSPKRSRRDD